ncbi:MAG TPA: diadenylate cyclase [Bryobacteraceae bacterium]|nr:diadenylate cyclase [Bryobacteraceae bacterium]
MELLRWQTIPDFLVLTAALYILLLWANQARALRIALFVVGLHAGALAARQFDLVVAGLVLDAAAALAVVMLLVVFQPELRRAFTRLDSALRFGPRIPTDVDSSGRAIAEALFVMAASRIGAIIVLVRNDLINEMVDGGVEISGKISQALLESIFQKTSPLHDGAVICSRRTLEKANVILPLTQRQDVPFYFGTRHRAAMGLAERCDAVVLVSSEERAEVTAMSGQEIRHLNSAADLILWLEKLGRQERQSWTEKLGRYARSNLGVKAAAAGLAALIWFLSFVATGTTTRTIGVPVEFLNVPAGMDIADQSYNHVDVELRGKSWLMDTGRVSSAIAHFDLHDAREGVLTLHVMPRNLNLPPGIEITAVTPRELTVRLKQRSAISAKPN